MKDKLIKVFSILSIRNNALIVAYFILVPLLLFFYSQNIKIDYSNYFVDKNNAYEKPKIDTLKVPVTFNDSVEVKSEIKQIVKQPHILIPIEKQPEVILKTNGQYAPVIEKFESKKVFIRNNFTQFFKTCKSSFTKKEPNGIIEINIVLENKSEFHIDSALVEVQYFSNVSGIVTSSMILFQNVNPFSMNSLPAPSNDEAHSLSIYFVEIKSKALNFFYSTENSKRKNNDPYKHEFY